MKHFFLQHFHLCVLLLRVLSCILVPAGIYLLAKGYRLLRSSYQGPLLLEIPLTQSVGEFAVSKAGVYAIWQKGELLRYRPIETIRPHIHEALTNNEIQLRPSLSGKQFSNDTQKRIETYTFHASAGRYKLTIESGLPLSKLDAYMEGIFPLPVDEAATFLQIRETQSGSRTMLSVPLLLLGAIIIIAGLLLISVVEWIVRL